MAVFKILGKLFIPSVLFILEVSNFGTVFGFNPYFPLDPQQQRNPHPHPVQPYGIDHIRRDLIARIHSLPPAKLTRFKQEAAQHLQTNLARAFRIFATSVDKVPPPVRIAARKVLVAIQAGRLNPLIVRHLPAILSTASIHQGHPGHQLRAILVPILPHVPVGLRNPLNGVLGFVSANLVNVNNLLSRVLGQVPDLLAGVITNLTGSLGFATESLSGVLGSLGALLGGVIG